MDKEQAKQMFRTALNDARQYTEGRVDAILLAVAASGASTAIVTAVIAGSIVVGAVGYALLRG